jgi:hypothetical protein
VAGCEPQRQSCEHDSGKCPINVRFSDRQEGTHELEQLSCARPCPPGRRRRRRGHRDRAGLHRRGACRYQRGVEAGPSNGATNDKGTNNSSTHGVSRVSTGYIVGCQVDITGLGGSIGAGVDLSGPSVSGSLTVPVSAGQVKFVGVAGKDITGNGTYSVQYQDTQLEIQNCGGFAQARSYTVVEIVGNDYSKTTLYGQPFSIG